MKAAPYLTVCLSVCMAAYVPGAEPVPTNPSATLIIVCSGLEPVGGSVYVALWRDAVGWPEHPGRDATTLTAPAPTATSLTLTIPQQLPGRVAVSVFQDRDGNGRITMGTFGPREPWGTSRNRTHAFRGPDFAESALDVGPGETVIPITIHH